MSKKLESYCNDMLLDFSIVEDKFEIDDKVYQIVPLENEIFDEVFEFVPVTNDEVDGYIYYFGGRWYIQPFGEKVPIMEELVYLGKPNQKIETKAFLGIHSGYELLNGVGMYEQWINKANFLGIKTLGILEKNTLAGVIAFQNICKKNGIKPIIGFSFDIKGTDESFTVKAFVENYQGWLNALWINGEINVVGRLNITKEELNSHKEGLILVIDPKTTNFKEKPNFINCYQLDTVVFENNKLDAKYVDNLQEFILSDLKPLPIVDAYYIEQRDFEAREILWGIGKKYDYKTKNQYFKNNDQYAKELIQIFEKGNKSWQKLWVEMHKNQDEIIERCNFEYDTINRRLPKYKMTEEEKRRFPTKDALFLHLLKEGFKERKISDGSKYLDRLKEEIRVLQKGDVVDYFLVLHDIISYAKKNNILVGLGRGSAGGSLVSYLLGIIQINPIEFKLLFERFLNDGRMGYMKECRAFKINDELTLNEGSILEISRNSKKMIIFVEDLKEGDEIIKY